MHCTHEDAPEDRRIPHRFRGVVSSRSVCGCQILGAKTEPFAVTVRRTR